MARLFLQGSSEYLEIDQAAISGTPFTMACWFYSIDVATTQVLMFVGDKDAADSWHRLFAAGATVGDPVRVSTIDGGGSSTATTTTGYSANTWHHACGVLAASNDRRVFIDGGSKGTSGVNRAPPSAFDRTSIGREGDSSPRHYMDGRMAEAVIWSAALTDNEVFQHAQGMPAPFIRPQSIAGYWPMFESDREFWRDVLNMTAFNTPSWATHAPKVLEHWRRYQERAVTKQEPVIRMAPWVWNRWSPKGGFVRMPRYGYTLFQDPGII